MAAATQKKRRLDEDDAAELATLNEGEMIGPAEPHADAKRVAFLEGKLRHLRTWMQFVQSQVQAMNRDTVFNARRLFVGGVPIGTSDEELSKFLGDAIINVGAAVSSQGRPVTFCRVQRDKNFAFVEVRSAEEASNVMALDGLVFKDVPLKINRPSKYDATAAYMLGPTDPDPSLDLSKVTIIPPTPAEAAQAGSVVVAGAAPVVGPDGQVHGQPGKYEANDNTLYIGGLPVEWTHDQCMELLKMYGDVKYFRLMMDRLTGNSRGFAFAEYTTDQATVAALAALDGAQLGPRRIAANRMLEHKRKEMLKNPQGMQQQQWGQQMPGGGASGGWGRQAGSGGAGMGSAQHSMGGMGMQAGGMGAPGGGMMGGGATAPGAHAGQGGMQQQGMYGAGAGANMAAGGMPGVDAGQGQQGMYGAAAGGAAGGYDGFGGQMHQGGGMYGSQMPAQQQSGMGMMGAGQGAAAGGMGMGGYGAQMGAAGAAGGMGMGAGYGQMDQQQGGYGAQMGAAGYAGGSQPAPPPRMNDFMPAASGAGAGAAGMGGGNMGGWGQGQQQWQ